LTQFPALVHSLQIALPLDLPTATAAVAALTRTLPGQPFRGRNPRSGGLPLHLLFCRGRGGYKPIKSLNELAAWRPGQTVRQPSALAPREDLPTSSPRVLVCHDMQGGYLDDAYLYGNANASAFRLFHWHLIDSFVYFSHPFSDDTPPLAGWTCATGTKDAIGWADRLIDLADAGGFDGWLINVEVALPAELVPALQAFVRRLKSKPAGWPSFSRRPLRALTVYVGVDCFGRGCPGGGGFNCCGGCANDCRESAAGRWTVRARLGLRDLPNRGLNQTKPMETPANLWESLVDRTLEFWAGMTPLLGEPGPWLDDGRLQVRLGRVFLNPLEWDRGRLVSTNAWNSLWERTRCRTIGCAVLSSTCRLCRSRRLAGRRLSTRRSERPASGGGIGGNGGCELPLFRLSLPARQVRALKLVYSLDSVFEDRPLDPVTVCLVAKYRPLIQCRFYRRGPVSLQRRQWRRQQPDSGVFLELCAGKLKATPTARAGGAAGHGGVVWHMVYTEAADPALVDSNNKDAGYVDKDCVLET
uniref:Mannosyl-glycoprotein endo-beta-N-acetylglucosaminidase n=1 Tax=Macrostomum lignano TaxID=282301 RepID=A0A1I8FAI8_9PLAT